MKRRIMLLGALWFSAAAQPLTAAEPAIVKVRLETAAGPIVIALDLKHAPITSRNFLAYVDQKRFDGTTFYRAARADKTAKEGFVEGGISGDMTRLLKPIAHEPTSRTGIHHVDGTVSMARDKPGTATGDFFIVVGDNRYLDASAKDPGYAAFGHVVSGMPVVRKMLLAPTFKGGWSSDTKDQSIIHRISITSVRRVP
jgi:peptidyl-prolyl cis-trans isomerase A (cyclophilin A)